MITVLKIRDNIQFGCSSCFCDLSIYVQKQMKPEKKMLYVNAETELQEMKLKQNQ